MAEVGITLLILRQQDKPIDARAYFRWTRNGEHSSNDGLNSLPRARFGKRHCRVKAIAIRERCSGKSKLRSPLRNGLGLHRAFEHRERGEDAKGNIRLSHGRSMG